MPLPPHRARDRHPNRVFPASLTPFQGRGGGASRGRGGGRGGGPPPPGGDKPRREAILDLSKYVNERIRVKFTGGREGEFIFALIPRPRFEHA